MITDNVIQRVFQLQYGNGMGTCFTTDDGNDQYFVTARHVLQVKDKDGKVVHEMQKGEKLSLLHNGNWKTFEALQVKHSSESDVSVFVINTKIEAGPLSATSAGLVYGQDVFFLGFPFGLNFNVPEELNRNFPVPLAKKGIVSAMLFGLPGKPFLIGGHGNIGFSGGPVIFKRLGTNEFQIAGVISSSIPEYKTEGGKLVAIEYTTSGFVKAFLILNATNLIEEIKKETKA